MTMPADRDEMGGVANQRLAADPRTSAWVSANAGTGKTHVLIDRISRLLLADVRPERLLCLTFTKAAAATMANRLNERLALWARSSDDELRKSLLYLTGAPPQTQDLASARRLFAQVLEAPGGLKIRTIHSFCESLLGRFPLEAGVSPHFSVLDERTAAELLEEARDRLLVKTQHPGGEDVADALKTLAGLVGEDGFAKLKKELAFRRGLFATQRQRAGGMDALINTAYTDLGLDRGDTDEAVIAQAVDEVAFDEHGLRLAVEALAGGTKTDKERAQKLGDWLAADITGRTSMFISDYVPIFLKKDGDAKARKMVITDRNAEANPQAESALLAEQARLVEMNERRRAIRTAETTTALIRFGGALLDEYETLKSTRALLDYDDLILKAAGLLESNDGVSWVHFKLDGGIDHILIDESQDNSPEQWRVIRRIAADFHSGVGVKEPGERTVFAVGDEKQSIYSFQGADPDGFHHMRQHFRKRVTDTGCKFQEVELIESYRSVPYVLAAIDHVFAGAHAADGVRAPDKEIRHHTVRRGQSGLVEVWPVVTPLEKPADVGWDAPVDRVGTDAPPVVLAERIAHTIKHWIDSGTILESLGRPIKESDIMILVRKRGTFADAMIRALKVRGVPVAGSDRMKLTGQLAVMDLMSLGQFALMPEDDLTLAEVLKGPLIGFDDGALYDVAQGRSASLWRSLQEKSRQDSACRHAVTFLGDILKHADHAPPYEFFSRVLGAKGGRRAIQSRLGHEAADPIDEFLSLSLDYERMHTPSLQGFLHWIAAGEIVVKRDLEIDRPEVRVLTVHGSKGLEANVVFLPDTLSVPDIRSEDMILWGKNSPLWPGDKNTEPQACRALREGSRLRARQEYHRLLYVAMTRARDRLYVCGFGSKRSEDCWYDLVRTAMEASGKAEDVAIPGFDEPGLRMVSAQEDDPAERSGGRIPVPQSSTPPPWALAPAPDEPAPPRPLAPSRPHGEEPCVRSPLGADDGARFKRGRLIHRLLQSLPDLDPQKRADAARNYLSRPVHGLGEEARLEIINETLAVLEHPEFAPLFGPGSRAEVAVSGEISGQVISGQVDRLLVTAQSVSIIDFKTNRPPPPTEDQVPEIYLRQMAAYRDALAQIYPGRDLTCLLLWTDDARLMTLTDSLLDRHAP